MAERQRDSEWNVAEWHGLAPSMTSKRCCESMSNHVSGGDDSSMCAAATYRSSSMRLPSSCPAAASGQSSTRSDRFTAGRRIATLAARSGGPRAPTGDGRNGGRASRLARRVCAASRCGSIRHCAPICTGRVRDGPAGPDRSPSFGRRRSRRGRDRVGRRVGGAQLRCLSARRTGGAIAARIAEAPVPGVGASQDSSVRRTRRGRRAAISTRGGWPSARVRFGMKRS